MLLTRLLIFSTYAGTKTGIGGRRHAERFLVTTFCVSEGGATKQSTQKRDFTSNSSWFITHSLAVKLFGRAHAPQRERERESARRSARKHVEIA